MHNKIRTTATLLAGLSLATATGFAGDQLDRQTTHDARYVSLDGPLNFRDLGGLQTIDGRTVKWGTLYRSDKLSELSANDLDTLKQRKIRYVVDFRSPAEQEEEPDNFGDLNEISYHHLPLYTKDVPVSWLERIVAMMSADDMGEVLVKSNRALIRDSTDEYRAWFDLLLNEDNTPMIFHCSGGKDRTGLATALLLTALGVPRDTIFEDYLATNDFVEESVNETLDKISFYSLGLIDPQDVRPVMMVDRKYLTAAFETIDELYGNMDVYLQDGLGLTAAKQQKLKAMYLAPAENRQKTL